MAMLEFKAARRAAGLVSAESELPDYLPTVLDFAAAHPRGERLPRAHRADLELLLRALREAGTPYAWAVDGICAVLPALRRPEVAAVTRAWRDGPPGEGAGPPYLALAMPEGVCR